MDNQLVVSKPFSLVPRDLNEAMKFAELIANSDICPPNLRGKSGNVLVTIQMGMEVGLSPLQSLMSVEVIKGKPVLYGDGALAVVQAHPSYEAHEEFIEGSGDLMRAICRVKRKGSPWHEVVFDVPKAKKANLWGKPGPWTQYPEIMLKMRARGFALRDKFADALKGIITKEEVEDYPNGNGSDDKIKFNPNLPTGIDSMTVGLSYLPEESFQVTSSKIDRLDYLKSLIEKHQISENIVNKWCIIADVKSLEECPEEFLDKFIKGVKNKYEHE